MKQTAYTELNDAKEAPLFSLFDSPIGTYALAWLNNRVQRVHLPERNSKLLREKLLQRGFRLNPESLPSDLRKTVKHVHSHFSGTPNEFREVDLDLEMLPKISRILLEKARSIPPGSVVTYGELATAAGRPRSARAAGQALARNPWPILIPCHRIIGRSHHGGFSAHGQLEKKSELLFKEGANLHLAFTRNPLVHLQDIQQHLAEQDPLLGAKIKKLGPLPSRLHTQQTLFDTLTKSIIYQQLAGKAAATIYARFKKLFPKEKPTPQDIIKKSFAELRSAGVSENKARALKDLSEKMLSGTLPTDLEALFMNDETLLERLTAVRGIGPWTAQMFLLFNLGRPDVMALDDYGLRKGFMRLYGKRSLPSPKQLESWSKRWRPYRSVASLYLWAAADAT